MRLLELHPFDRTEATRNLGLRAGMVLSPTRIRLHFEWKGALAARNQPKPDPEALLRADELWKSTCFEAFILKPSGYLEFNLSLHGQWNVYRFSEYRKPQPPQAAADWRLSHYKSWQGGIEAQFEGPEPEILESQQKGRAGLTAVIQQDPGGLSYWALSHPAPQPDFHHPEGWTLSLSV